MGCPICGDQAYETTTLGQSRRTFICRNAHWFTPVRFRSALCIGVMQGPAVPTPGDLLKGAGLDLLGW